MKNKTKLQTFTAMLVFVTVIFNCSGSGSGTAPTPPPEENKAPVIQILPLTADHDLDYDQVVKTRDDDGDKVTVTANSLPGWLSFDPETYLLSGTPGESNIGQNWPVKLTATDGKATVTKEFTLSVVLGTSTLIMQGSWFFGTPKNYGHDGHPYESENFVVYSGFSSQESRQQAAELLEEIFLELKTLLDIVPERDLQYLNPNGKTDVFLNKIQDGTHGWAYPEGLILLANDSPRYTLFSFTDESYKRLAKHELMHVVEFLMLGDQARNVQTETWMREGMASYVAAPWPSAITEMTQVAAWRNLRSGVINQGNPISVHIWSDFPPEILADPNSVTGTTSYYKMFVLGVEYLLSPKGHGKSILDFKQIYFDIKAGIPLAQSFESRMGMTIEYYENNFWDMIAEYFSK